MPSGGVVVPPTLTSCHCWWPAPVSVDWTMFVPSAVEPFCGPIALPLLRLISRTYPSEESARRNCWLAPLRSGHWTTWPLSAVDQLYTSSTLPESFDLSR